MGHAALYLTSGSDRYTTWDCEGARAYKAVNRKYNDPVSFCLYVITGFCAYYSVVYGKDETVCIKRDGHGLNLI